MAQTGIDRLRALTAQLNRYRYEYYSLNAPTVSDEVYDRLFDELGQLERAEAKLSNEKFMSKAPADVVEGVRANCEKLRENVKHIQESLKGLQG